MLSSRSAYCIIFLLKVCMNTVVTCLEVVILPEHIHVPPGNDATIECQTKNYEVIVGCQFRVWHVGEKTESVLLDATTPQGRDTIPNPYGLDTNYNATYHRYFDKGRCGVTLRGLRGSQLLVGCKLVIASKVAAVKTMSLFQTNRNKLGLQETIRQVTVRPGDSVDILLKSDSKLTKCTSTLVNGVTVQAVPGNFWVWSSKVPPAASRYKQYGGRLDHGECGFTISNVLDEDNGVFYVLADGNSRVGAKAVILIVESVDAPVLVLDKTEYSNGETLAATCSVRGVNLEPDDITWTWTLGGNKADPKRQRTETTNVGWLWPWQEAEVSQSVTLSFHNEDGGKELSCLVSVSENDDPVASNNITVTFKTNPIDSPVAHEPDFGTTVPKDGGVIDEGEVMERDPIVNTSSVTEITIFFTGNMDNISSEMDGEETRIIRIGVSVLLSVIIIGIIIMVIVIKQRGKTNPGRKSKTEGSAIWTLQENED